MQFDGKRVVIIGGSSGIGLETALLVLADGGLPDAKRVRHRRRAAGRWRRR
jgi:NAD(P)-dependent dehydrogenase (short-subunit alcohol dehydrogenase family)